MTNLEIVKQVAKNLSRYIHSSNGGGRMTISWDISNEIVIDEIQRVAPNLTENEILECFKLFLENQDSYFNKYCWIQKFKYIGGAVLPLFVIAGIVMIFWAIFN